MLETGSKSLRRLRNRPAVRLVALLVGVPLAVVGGVRTVGWAAATLKTWVTGETLTAVDLNGNFTALATAQAPDQVVATFNAGVTAGGTVTLGAVTPAQAKFDLRWAMQHAAAAGACAAVSPLGDSPAGHVVMPKPSGVTCTAACAANTAGMYTTCRTGIAIGSVRMTQAALPTDVVATNYNYGCGDTQNFDETLGKGVPPDATFYTEYCCCYRAP
jgi:hypothetical protein